MKYCPYCGADLIDSTIFFCPECGKPLKKSKDKLKSSKNENFKKKQAKKQIISREHAAFDETQAENVDTSYDGYYDDINPIDASTERQGLDKGMIKNIIIIIVSVLFAISICVAAMYFM